MGWLGVTRVRFSGDWGFIWGADWGADRRLIAAESDGCCDTWARRGL